MSAIPAAQGSDTADVLVIHGAKADAAAVADLLSRYSDLCARGGRPKPRAVTTTPDDHGAGLAADAVRSGARLVVACGGDGTVNEVAFALAGTDATLGIVPLGTGNLLARNLGISADTDAALAVLVDGAERRIDAGRIDGRIFLGMAGMGLDAAMIEGAPETLKRRAGWAAYAVALVRHLSDRIQAVSVEVDGRRTRHRNVSMLLVGNIGRLQVGLEPLPDAEVDDGLLDLAVVLPRGPLAWLRVAAALRGGQAGTAERTIHRDRGVRITIRTRRPVPREFDGELLPAATSMDVEVLPGALRVRVEG
ncbi:diacylglycerol/lipid kinase family protein [Actinospica robiniae]|uniref:Sphingosine/diacylglycerol kinase-like enzyme n=1 Tax=Actinospica robiniae DSM 44927 TaxID=479430 RepID=W9DZ91_9ACTN|nr:diacylglycerol kinase family protein [Actinospica robiniae]ETA71128.1 sphingosine/diacylglycerol kinase-like enzyme [Actinospica robiniae DSM 44927]